MVSVPLFCGLMKVNDKYYGNRYDMNGLFSINFETESIELEKIYSGVDIFASWQFCNPVFANNCLYNIPCCADNIAVYSFEDHKWDIITFEDESLKEVNAIFDAGYLVNNKIWMLPKDSYCVADLDIYTGKIRYHEGFRHIVEGIYNDMPPHIVKKTFVVGNKLYMALWDSSYLIVYDTDNESFSRIRLVNDDCHVLDVVPLKDTYVFLCSDGRICGYVNGRIMVVDYINDIDSLGNLLLVDDSVWVIDRKENIIKIITVSSSGTAKYEVKNIKLELGLSNGFLWYDGGTKIYNLPNSHDEQISIVDKNTYFIENRVFRFNKVDQKKYVGFISEEQICYEGQLPIIDFLHIFLNTMNGTNI